MNCCFFGQCHGALVCVRVGVSVFEEREGGLTGAGSVMVTFVSPGGAAGVLFTSVTFNFQP